MLRIGYSIVLLLVACIPMTAQELQDDAGYFANPQSTPYGTVITNNFASALYIVRDGALSEIVSAPGCGNYYSLSHDRRLIGMKIVGDDGMQSPAIYDLASNKLSTLAEPSFQSGQVSFTDDGRMAFTRGEQLIVRSGDQETRYSLGSYSNLAPISPDGKIVAFNDRSDQIWVIALQSGERRCISDGKLGYFNPVWSPDGAKLLYSSLNGGMKTYDLESGRTFDLGEGLHPSWSPDSRTLVFHQTETERGKLMNSDIFISEFNSSERTRLSNTTDVTEMDPSFIDDGQIIYHTYTRRSLVVMAITSISQGLQKSSRSRETSLPSSNVFTIAPVAPVAGEQKSATLDIPYIHQAYDTPDWFNGDAACGPTTAMMLMAYYNILPKWPTPSSSKGFHYNDWAYYICSQYQYRQVNYITSAADPSGHSAWGGYGYMWSGSNRPYTRLSPYYTNHGLTATQTDATPYSTAYDEVTSGHPFTMCVLLTSAGHFVLAHGIGNEPHTFIVNDCWGDKNRGYPNYYGKNTSYDWPGYNNGYQNLVQVAWGVATRYSPLAVSDTIIDDLQYGHGFSMLTSAPASMTLWKDLNAGYLGHAWYAATRNSGSLDTCCAVWTPTLPDDGDYEVSAFIPPGSTATSAVYHITYNGGVGTATVDQSGRQGSWVSLGAYRFLRGTTGSVRLGDASTTAGQMLAFDAIQWSRTRSSTTVAGNAASLPGNYILYQNYPNPANPSTTIRFEIPATSYVLLQIYSVSGQLISTLLNGEKEVGLHQITWDAQVPSGVYFCRLTATAVSTNASHPVVRAMKMLLIR